MKLYRKMQVSWKGQIWRVDKERGLVRFKLDEWIDDDHYRMYLKFAGSRLKE